MLVLFAVIVFGPIVSERLRIPGIVGLIVGGMVFGPFVIGWLEADGLVTELGAIGILYLMFLAGLSFDIKAFNDNRRSAIVYGLLGFFVPFLLSVVVVLALFDLGLLAAALVGAMWASNTLVAYPEVQSAGLQNNRAVSAAVSAGVVADLFSLTVLAFATATAVVEIEPLPDPFDGRLVELAGEAIEPTTPDPTLPLWAALPLLAGFCLWLLPRITDAFFVRVGRSRPQRFAFALAGMAAGTTIALIGGVEGLIGAFLAGLGMNRLVPSKGPLMDRLDFVGTTIFIPTFLISIGLNIDPVLLIDRDTLLLGLLFTGFVFAGKSIAALITGLSFNFSFDEIALMSSLSFGQAASTLAIAQVGLSLGMFEQIVVNASVIAIVLTALITSYGVRYFADRVPKPVIDRPPIGAEVIVDIRAHGSDLDSLITLAAAIARHDDGLVDPYLITEPGQLANARVLVDAAVTAVTAQRLDAEGTVRVDDSFADGTLHLIEEKDVSLVVLSWTGPHFATDYLFGNDIDGIGENSPVPTMAVRLLRPWQRIIVVIGNTETDWRLEDARLAVDTARRLRSSRPVPLLVVTPDHDVAAALLGDDEVRQEGVEIVVAPTASGSVVDRLDRDDVVIAPAHVLHDPPPRAGWQIAKALDHSNLVIVGGPHRLSISKGVTRRGFPATSHAATGAG